MVPRKLTILILIDYYFPGYMAGGPTRSMMNFVTALGDDFDLYILTTDHDLHQTVPYPNITPGEWYTVGKAQVCYLSSRQSSLSGLARRLREIRYDLLYINGVLPTSSISVLLLRRLHLIPTKPVVVAPRGHLGQGSLEIKPLKKQVFLTAARTIRLYSGIIWHATSDEEIEGIRHAFPKEHLNIGVVPNLPSGISVQAAHAQVEKQVGQARIAFLSRIVPLKNLEYLLTSLLNVRGDVTVDIWGPLEDRAYWKRCCAVIDRLPTSIRVEYRGAVAPEKVVTTLDGYHLFYLPSHFENFGHVILEALSAGCPVLISDRTPWKQLEAQGIGWELSLDHPEKFQDVIQQIIDMNADDLSGWSTRARRFATQYVRQNPAIEQTRQFIADAAGSVTGSQFVSRND